MYMGVGGPKSRYIAPEDFKATNAAWAPLEQRFVNQHWVSSPTSHGRLVIGKPRCNWRH